MKNGGFYNKKIMAMLVAMIMTTSATPTAVTAFAAENNTNNPKNHRI